MFHSRTWSKALTLVLCGSLFVAPTLADDARYEIRLTPTLDPSGVFEVRGVGGATLKRFAKAKPDDQDWAQTLAVFVGEEPSPDAAPMLGGYEIEDGVLRFKPRFPLRRGLTYRAVFRASPDERPVQETFAIPAPSSEPAQVTAVYPTSSELPENLLKFYLHFSAPMSQGQAYDHLRLLDEAGEEVELPFLELPQELWSRDGKRLTVLLDPGRVKQGLVPREESGPVLVAGRRYTLAVDARWPDALGRPLESSHEKRFRAVKTDVIQPAPQRWKIAAPAADSRDPLIVRFAEPLDHAMLQRAIRVVSPDGQTVEGTARVDEKETRWSFTPTASWQAGRHALSVLATLEDRCGNSVGRPFEVDLNERPQTHGPARTVEVPVVVE